MVEMERLVKQVRAEAWKRIFQERIGRDHLSRINGFVVAGSIFDVLDDLDVNQEKKIKTSWEDRMKRHYNVYVYRVLRYPPHSSERKRFVE
jgi:hypothetical protein